MNEITGNPFGAINDPIVKQLQKIVKQQKREIFQLRSIIENLPGSVYWKDKKGIYLGRNTYSMKKMHSIQLERQGERDAVIGKTDYDFFPKEIADRYRKYDLEVMETEKELSLEEPVILPDGKIIIQLSTKRPLYDEKARVIGIIGNTVDITQIKEIESELREAKEKAEQANIVKTEFIRNMEHDIRTPFCGVLGIASYLRDIEKDEEKKEYLTDITDCAEELLDYCNSIFDFSKIEAGMLIVLNKKFDLMKLIDSAIKIERPAASNKNLQLSSKLDTNIPAILIGDHYRVYRILLNLLSNAIKFTEKGCVKLSTLLVKKMDRSVVVRFIIEDTGIGVPLDKQEYVFEKFTRLSLSNRGFYKGIGLGLQVVKRFMHEIEGEIDLISKVGQGTKFICTIPFDLPLTDDFVEP